MTYHYSKFIVKVPLQIGVYRLRHTLIDPEVIKVRGQGHALPVRVCKDGNLGGTTEDRPPTFRVGDIATYIPHNNS